MKLLIQRVSAAQVTVAARTVGAIDRGLLLLIGIERDDTPDTVQRMVQKLLNYRLFADGEGKMNLSVQEVGGGILAISQFTLAADTQKGLRPGFSKAAAPEIARQRYEEFVRLLQARHAPVATGVFGADMQVTLTNDGPVTFLLEL